MRKYTYINPVVILSTVEILKAYKAAHPDSATPMADCCAGVPECDRARFIRAAKRLKWNVTKYLGHIYENGFFVW